VVIINILLYNDKNEIISVYTQNNSDFQKDDEISVSNKKYKVINIEKYRKLDVNESVEQVTLELKAI
jgi:hypothetical protein